MTAIDIRPQAGPQEAFLSTPADIAIYGGAAGGGKTYALLLETLRNINVPDFGAVIFRKNATQITVEGGLWDESNELYPLLGAVPIMQPYRWTFPSKNRIEFHHLQNDPAVLGWQGAQIPLICFDELTHFSHRQFFYMLSRNRSMSGVRPYIRAATNPDPESWLKQFIGWWIGDDGFPLAERSGKLRFMVRSGDEIIWFNDYSEARDFARKISPDMEPKSVTFIPSSVYDNKILIEKDPTYLANLMALPRYERALLLDGNWNVKLVRGTIFARSDFEIVDVAPPAAQVVRFWDRAATEPNPSNTDPDWTAGVKMMKAGDTCYIVDVVRFRARPGEVKTTIKNVATQDGYDVEIGGEQEPGASGKSEASDLVASLAGFSVRTKPASGKKFLRWKPLSAAAQNGQVKLVRGRWIEAFLSELENVTDNESEYAHDDQADAAAGAFQMLNTPFRWRIA